MLDNNENKRDKETRIFTWKPLREKTTDARRRNHYDGGVLQARDDRLSEVRLHGVYKRAIHESPWRTSKRVVLVRVDVNAKAHTVCTTSSPTRY